MVRVSAREAATRSHGPPPILRGGVGGWVKSLGYRSRSSVRMTRFCPVAGVSPSYA